MRNYSWSYGIFHWFVHYLLTVMLWWASGIVIFPFYITTTLFGNLWQPHIVDYFVVIVISSLVDLDHLFVLKKFGFKKYIWAENSMKSKITRIVSPLHNFFFLSTLSILSAFMALFVSQFVAVLLFAVVLHILWDIFEDVFIFRTSFRKWEKTWGLDKKDLELTYNDIMQMQAEQPKKESRISKVKKIGSKLKEKIKRKKEVPVVAVELS